MDSILKEKATMPQRKARQSAGFSMLETMIALVVLAVGILGLAAMLGDSLAYMQGSQEDFIAQQKAEQAVEAIFTAKYTNTITWAQVANFSVGNPTGLFLPGALPLTIPGTDGLVGTAVDAVATPDFVLQPGPDGKLGTADDVQVPLTNFTRTITITPYVGDANLRNIAVTVNYSTGRFQRSYTINTLISAFD
jgi:type II secretory pathway pseudopilin PulG